MVRLSTTATWRSIGITRETIELGSLDVVDLILVLVISTTLRPARSKTVGPRCVRGLITAAVQCKLNPIWPVVHLACIFYSPLKTTLFKMHILAAHDVRFEAISGGLEAPLAWCFLDLVEETGTSVRIHTARFDISNVAQALGHHITRVNAEYINPISICLSGVAFWNSLGECLDVLVCLSWSTQWERNRQEI